MGDKKNWTALCTGEQVMIDEALQSAKNPLLVSDFFTNTLNCKKNTHGEGKIKKNARKKQTDSQDLLTLIKDLPWLNLKLYYPLSFHYALTIFWVLSYNASLLAKIVVI